MRIRYRIFLTYLGVALILVVAGGAILYDALVDEARAGIEERLATGVRMLAADLSRPDAPASARDLDARVNALAAPIEARLTVVAPDGTVVADSEFDGPALAALDDHSRRPEVAGARARGESASVRYSRSVGEDLVYRARRIDEGPWTESVARMAVPATRVSKARATALGRVVLGLGAALALALAAGAFWAQRLSRPIDDLARVAARVGDGDLEARARVETGDELEELARAIEAANARLAGRIRAATSERDRLETVLDAMVEGVLVTDGRGRIVLANAALREIFGLERALEGRTVIEALRHPEAAEAMARAAVGAEAVTREIALTWPTSKRLALQAAPLERGGAVGVFHDVSALVRAEEVRRDFVANVSHELRTPLATLAGYAEALSDPDVGPMEARGHAGVIRRQVDRLTALVADLLELARLESEGFAPATEEVDVEALVADLEREWRPRLEVRDMALEARAEEGLVARVEPGLLRQAIGNLLDNAAKYGRRGGRVRLTAGREDGTVVFAVSDDGPGIPREEQARLFERFYRVEKGRARGTGGTGLGLAIVKEVAEAHGGAVRVESAPGRGATFRLTIPG